jgi:Flp pilus assembly pilin Flp
MKGAEMGLLSSFAWLNVARLHALSQRCMRGSDDVRRGQSTVEYALVGALVVIAAAGAMTVLGDQVSAVFGHIKDTLAGAVH